MQAITTRYHGPTDFRGARISARCQAGKIFVPYTYEGDEHVKAAKALAEKLGWWGVWVEGGMPDGRGNVYVCTDGVLKTSAAFTIEKREGR